MTRSIILALAAVLACALSIHPDAAGQPKKEHGRKKPTQAEMMKRWQAAMTPGEAQKKLEVLAGSWEALVKNYVAGPDSEPSVSGGRSVNEMIMGGRFLRQQFSGSFMGRMMEGVGYTGYDNFRKKYVGFWIDNLSTAMAVMEGSMSADGKTLTMTGTMDEPMTGEKNKKVQYVTRVRDEDKHVFQVYDLTTYGDKRPVLEISYIRR